VKFYLTTKIGKFYVEYKGKLKMNNLDPNIILKDENDIYEDNVDKNDVTVTISKNLFNYVEVLTKPLGVPIFPPLPDAISL